MSAFSKTWIFAALLWPALCAAGSKSLDEWNAVLAATPDEVRGAGVFGSCVRCHGVDGGGTFEGSTPRIAGQHFRVLVRQLIDFRYGKRWDFRMENVAADLHTLADAQDIADVASYVSHLTRDGARGVGDGTLVAHGATLYGGRCQRCHGIAGEGDNSRGIPKIGGQHAAYLARQIYDAVDGRRLPLAKTHRKFFAKFGYEDVLGLTDFLARAGWSDAPPPDPAPPNPTPPYDTPDK